MAGGGRCHALLLLLGVQLVLALVCAGHDYGQALTKSILYFEAQRSGHLPANQRVAWRADSGLSDGKDNGINLVGGYYDAGDNVKFGLPMAFTVTMLSWSIIEYGSQMAAAGELQHAMDAVKWGTDYFIKAHPEPDVLYGEVGDGNTDHFCWQRPEDMTTSRKAYRLDTGHPGSDLAGETAAAMAAASLVFRESNPAYANQLIQHSKQLFAFADKYRGKYDRSIVVAENFYQSFDGYEDELLWAAAWLYKASNDMYYLNYLVNNADTLGGIRWTSTEFGWDVKYPGAQVLAAKLLLQGKGGPHTAVLDMYRQKAELFMCSCLGKGPLNVPKTPGGLMYRQHWNNLQFVTASAFLLTAYSDYLSSSGRTARCPNGAANPDELLAFAKSQVDYILGSNPRATSYMVGYGAAYPRQVHHRGASIVSVKVNPRFISCKEGYDVWYGRSAGDPNVLHGAIVGGPDGNDQFHDERNNYEQTEAATYNTAPLVGVLARLAAGNAGYNDKLIPGKINHKPGRHSPQRPKAGPGHPKATRPHWHPKATPRARRPQTASAALISIEQNETTSWAFQGRMYHRYSVRVTNTSPKALEDLHIGITKLQGPVWGLSKLRHGRYALPTWMESLPAGKTMEFVYIHDAPQADVWATGYKIGL